MKYIVFFILVTIITNSVFAQDLVFDLDFKDSPTGILTEAELKLQAEEPNMWTLLGNRGKVVNDAERGKVLNVEYPQGAAGPYDAGIQFIKPLPESNEYFLDYYVRFDEGFDFKLGGKLPGLTSGGSAWTGGNRPVNGEGWSARYMWVANGRMLVYLYYIDMPGAYGEDISLNMNFETGRWYRLTQRIKLNDDDVNGNGILQVWVDGNMVVDRNNLRYRLGDKGMIDSFYFSTFHGGAGSDWAPRNDSYTSFDAIKVTKTKPVFELDDNDKTPPTIIKAFDTFVGDEVVIEFSENITKTSAENPVNYTVDGEAKVLSATLGINLKTVTLITTKLDGDLENHTVTANNVEDINGNKAVNTSASFIYLVDRTLPTILRANDTYDSNRVVLEFSERVTEASAENYENYDFDENVSVLSASLGSDLVTVTLTTSELDGSLGSHTVWANNVEDLSGNKSQNTSASFSYICDAISASSWQQSEIWGYHPPENAFDGDLATKWAADGVGEYLQRRFCISQLMKSVDIAFWKGNERVYSFDISVSQDGTNFDMIYSGNSSGNSTALEIFDIPDTDARFIRITGNGNNITDNNWNNILEIVIDAEESEFLSIEDNCDNNLLLYPNPVINGEFVVELKGVLSEEIKLELYQINGAKLESNYYINREKLHIKLNDKVQGGVYILKLINYGEIYWTKVAVQ